MERDGFPSRYDLIPDLVKDGLRTALRGLGRLFSEHPLPSSGHPSNHSVPFERPDAVRTSRIDEMRRDGSLFNAIRACSCVEEPTIEMDRDELNAHLWGNTHDDLYLGQSPSPNQPMRDQDGTGTPKQ